MGPVCSPKSSGNSSPPKKLSKIPLIPGPPPNPAKSKPFPLNIEIGSIGLTGLVYFTCCGLRSFSSSIFFSFKLCFVYFVFYDIGSWIYIRI